MSGNKPPLVYIQGIDGTGKSATAHGVATNLSEAYPLSVIHVTDSSGLHIFRRGRLAEHRYGRLSALEPRAEMSALNSVAHLAAFALARRCIDGRVQNSSLHISVRDSHRIDPALYASAYGLWGIAKLTPEQRLCMFNNLTWAPFADSVVHLQTDVANVRLEGRVDPHETREKLEVAAKELPVLLEAYTRMSGSCVFDVPALNGSTIVRATTLIEPLIDPSAPILSSSEYDV